jgi:hypothetical protein
MPRGTPLQTVAYVWEYVHRRDQGTPMPCFRRLTTDLVRACSAMILCSCSTLHDRAALCYTESSGVGSSHGGAGSGGLCSGRLRCLH